MRYLVRERIFSIGDDFWITDEQGNRVFLVDGKALRLRETFELKDASGAILATVKKKLISIRDTMDLWSGYEAVQAFSSAGFGGPADSGLLRRGPVVIQALAGCHVGSARG
jgi:hypothetical protein